jgi:hypothetical protein
LRFGFEKGNTSFEKGNTPMKQKITHGGKRAGAGRPATGKDPVRTLRLSDEFIARVDAWAASYEHTFETMSRSEAIRRLVQLGLNKIEKEKTKKVK